MNNHYEADLIEREKNDPTEAASVKFLNVPLILLSMFFGFGISYLGMQTDSVDFSQGDSRTSAAVNAPVSTGEEDLFEVGARLYKKNCQACHQATGAGLGAAFPPLDGSEWVTQDPETVSAILLHGVSGEIEVKGQTFKGAMPAFGEKLSNEEIAAIATYVRGSWSNKASPVDTQLVEKVAQATSERSSPWKGGAELKEQPWK